MLSVVTDIPDYAIWMAALMFASVVLGVVAKRCSDRSEARRIAAGNERTALMRAEKERVRLNSKRTIAAKQSVFDAIDRSIKRLESQPDPIWVHSESLAPIKTSVRTLRDCCADENKCAELDAALANYLSIRGKLPPPLIIQLAGAPPKKEHAAAVAVFLESITRLRSIAEKL